MRRGGPAIAGPPGCVDVCALAGDYLFCHGVDLLVIQLGVELADYPLGDVECLVVVECRAFHLVLEVGFGAGAVGLFSETKELFFSDLSRLQCDDAG